MRTLLEFEKPIANLEDKLIEMRKLAIENNTPAFYVLEPAVIAAKSEKPNKPELLLLTALCSFIFAMLWVLVTNREPSL